MVFTYLSILCTSMYVSKKQSSRNTVGFQRCTAKRVRNDVISAVKLSRLLSNRVFTFMETKQKPPWEFLFLKSVKNNEISCSFYLLVSYALYLFNSCFGVSDRNQKNPKYTTVMLFNKKCSCDIKDENSATNSCFA